MKKLSGVLAIIIFATRLLAQSNPPVRLALIAETDEASAASDVLTAQLSGNPKLHLLERNEIEKVYREQGLSAANKAPTPVPSNAKNKIENNTLSTDPKAVKNCQIGINLSFLFCSIPISIR